MIFHAQTLRRWGVAALLALATSGCLSKMILNGQIQATRQGSSSFDTIGDYELAQSAASAGLAQFEGMHRLAPENTDALFMLTKAWGGYAVAFPEDEYEEAILAKREDVAEYHRKRARMAYERAIYYGRELLMASTDGYDAAQKNNDSIQQWLTKNFTKKESAIDLFWVAFAMIGRIHLFQDDPALVSDLFIPVAMLNKSKELDPSALNYSASIALAAYHARTPDAEMDTARAMFEEIVQRTQGKTLMAKTQYAIEYACKKRDKALYERLLNDVLAAEDPDPEQRLNNMIAKRKAARALRPAKMAECSFGAPP